MTGGEEAGRRWEREHPGWLPLASLFGRSDPPFDRVLFLPGYEFSSNVYVVTGDRLSVVDPGNDYTAFLQLFERGLRPEEVGQVVLTHGHRDHAMGLFELLRAYAAPARAGWFDLVLHEAAPRQIKEAAAGAGCRVVEVRGGERLEMGGLAWDVLFTPGHTIDGICLHDPGTGAAFTGDTVLPHAVAGPDAGAGGRLDHYLFAARTLLARRVEHVFPGHGLPVAGAGKRVVEETYESLMLEAIGVEKGSALPWIDGAAALAEKGLLEEALFCCEKELLVRSDSRRALALSAACLNDMGRFEEALSVLGRLEACEPRDEADPFPFVGRGYALMGLGRYREALPFFDEALRRAPSARDAQIYKGMALYLAGDCEAAMEIEAFRVEFMGRFRAETLRRNGPRQAGEKPRPGEGSGARSCEPGGTEAGEDEGKKG